jgi:hypothetical protein
MPARVPVLLPNPRRPLLCSDPTARAKNPLRRTPTMVVAPAVGRLPTVAYCTRLLAPSQPLLLTVSTCACHLVVPLAAAAAHLHPPRGQDPPPNQLGLGDHTTRTRPLSAPPPATLMCQWPLQWCRPQAMRRPHDRPRLIAHSACLFKTNILSMPPLDRSNLLVTSELCCVPCFPSAGSLLTILTATFPPS